MRIINDYYSKNSDSNFNAQFISEDFYNRIKAIEEMYEYLDKEGILKTTSFKYYTDYKGTSFAINTENLECYKAKMLNSGTYMPDLAVRYIFDEKFTPCIYCGSIRLSWTMLTYRENCGCIGKSWECGMCRQTESKFVSKISEIRKEKGIQAAVSALWEI